MWWKNYLDCSHCQMQILKHKTDSIIWFKVDIHVFIYAGKSYDIQLPSQPLKFNTYHAKVFNAFIKIDNSVFWFFWLSYTF